MTTSRIRSPISSVLERRSRLSFTFFSWPERTCRAYHWGGSSTAGVSVVGESVWVTSDINLFGDHPAAGEGADHVGQHQIRRRDKPGQQDHGDNHDEGRF